MSLVTPYNPSCLDDYIRVRDSILSGVKTYASIEHFGSTSIPDMVAKPVIDIVAYRGGDMLMAWLFTGLTQGLGLGLAAVALVGAGIAALWSLVGIYLGRWFEQGEGGSVDRPSETSSMAPQSSVI